MDAFMKDTTNIEDPEEWLKKADELMNSLKTAGRISGEEAQKLGELPRSLLGASPDANRADAGRSKNPKSSKE